MSSTFVKALKCFKCSEYQPIEDINFPEDVFESIRQHKLDQNLFWICNTCKKFSNGVDFRETFAISKWGKQSPIYRNIDVHTPPKMYPTNSDVVSL